MEEFNPSPGAPAADPVSKHSTGGVAVVVLQALLVMLLLGAIGVAGYMYQSYQKTKQELDLVKRNPQKAAAEETRRLVTLVGKHIVLPSDETPTIATVLDKDKLKDQTFFARAQNGDHILIYPNAKKAFLYRESTNKVIEVGTINLEQTSTASQPTAGAAKP